MFYVLADATTDAGTQLNTALIQNVNPNTIVSQFVDMLPWIGLMVIVGFAIYEVRKMIKGSSKGKVRV